MINNNIDSNIIRGGGGGNDHPPLLSDSSTTATAIKQPDTNNDYIIQQTINKLNDTATAISTTTHDVIYLFMRDGIVSFTFLLVLFLMSHLIVRRFIRKKDVYKRVYLPRILCTFCLSVSLAAMLLIPITIISNEILTTFPSNYYTQWLNRDLIFSFWNKIFWGANISLFIILPFAYFYYEAEGIERSFLSRIKDALLVLSLVSVIFIAFVYVVYILFFDQMQGKKAIMSDYLPFSYSLISTSGTIFVLFCIPKGFNTLTSKGISLATPQSTDEIQAARLEILTLQDSLITNKQQQTDSEKMRIEIKLKELNDYIKQSEKRIKRPLLLKLIALLLTIVNFVFSAWVVLKVFVSLVKHIFEIITPFSWTSAASARVDNVYDFLAYSSKLGSLESIFETTVIIYLMISAFVGFFNISMFAKIRPSIASTSLRKMIINTAIILLMSSSFPVVVRILEISRFDLMGYYTHTNYLRNEVFKLYYRITFITALIQSYVQFLFPKSTQSPIGYVIDSIPYYKRIQQQRQQQKQQQKLSQPRNNNNNNNHSQQHNKERDSMASSSSSKDNSNNSSTSNTTTPTSTTSHILSLILSSTSSPLKKLTPTSSPRNSKRKSD